MINNEAFIHVVYNAKLLSNQYYSLPPEKTIDIYKTFK
jgi:hypothetical protein